MRIFLAGTHSCVKDLEESKDKSIYKLESFFSGEKTCQSVLQLYDKDNFLLDSGAFSYMNGKKTTEVEILEYLDKYINFINKYDVKYFFELDVDCIFGLSFVENMTKKLEKETGKKCIPVWHKSRGVDYFKKMVDNYEYIAIGGIVSKEIKKTEYNLMKKMVKYAKQNNCRVHGLGFT